MIHVRFFRLALMTCIAAMGVAGCYRQELETIELDIPQMGSLACSEAILNRLNAVDGVRESRPDLENHLITVVFDSTKLARRNVEYTVADLGFTVNGLPPREGREGALPAPCR